MPAIAVYTNSSCRVEVLDDTNEREWEGEEWPESMHLKITFWCDGR